MSPAPTESRIFATRYQREAVRLEQLHAGNIMPGATKWCDAIRAVYDRMGRLGSPIKQVAELTKLVNYVKSIKQEHRIAFPVAAFAAKRTAGLILIALEFESHPLVGPNEDGVTFVKFSIGIQRNGDSQLNVRPLAYISRHAIERMHERRYNPISFERATDMLSSVAALAQMIGFHPEHEAVSLDLGDVLAVGQMRAVRGEPDENGHRVTANMYEVRSMLPIDELDPNDPRLKQGRVALTTVTDWVKNDRFGAKDHASRVPILTPRSEDYTSKVAKVSA